MKFTDSNNQTLIYFITDGTATDKNFTKKKVEILTLLEAAVHTKIPLFQIREKNLAARFVFELASEAVKLANQSATEILVNDRADIALAAKADGVHLTSLSLTPEIIRRNFPENFIIGVSAHSTEEAESAKRQGANFVTFSPIFYSPNKGKPQGVEKLREICAKLSPFPVIALGGIDETNYKFVLKNGAAGFAAIRFLNDSKNLENIAAELSI